jgi:hypothetical protein
MIDGDLDIPEPETLPFEGMDVVSICKFLHSEGLNSEFYRVFYYILMSSLNDVRKFVEKTVTDYHWFIQTFSDKEAQELKELVQSVKNSITFDSIRSTPYAIPELLVHKHESVQTKCVFHRPYLGKQELELHYPKHDKHEITEWLATKYEELFMLKFPDKDSHIFELERIRDDLSKNNPRIGKTFTRHAEISAKLQPFMRRFESFDEEVQLLVMTISDMITEIVDEPTHVVMKTKSTKF